MRVILFIGILAFVLTSCKTKSPTYVIETNLGNIQVRLYEHTPLHRKNFEKLVAKHYYDSLEFHRVIKNFMIQTGNSETRHLSSVKTLKGDGGPGYTLAPEFVPEYFHKKGALAAARIGDKENPEKRSSGSQFYIVQGRKYTKNELLDIKDQYHQTYTSFQTDTYMEVGGTPFLDGRYTVFGEVTAGLEVLDKIASVSTGTGDWPLADVRIIRIKKK